VAVAARINNHAGLIWAIADLLRGDYKQSEYGRVILPLVVLRRLDCVLEPTKAKVLARLEQLRGKLENVGPVLQPITGIDVYNTSPLTLKRVLADPGAGGGLCSALAAAWRTVRRRYEGDRAAGKETELLAYFGFADLIKVITEDDELRRSIDDLSRDEWAAAVDGLVQLRNDVMHPIRNVDLAKDGLVRLQAIEQGIRFLIEKVETAITDVEPRADRKRLSGVATNTA
jgi:HsdM N-terminal domain